jgi:di/tricarboxylate transporter
MWSTLFWIGVGIVIGRNLPQPPWAKSLQDKVVNAIKDIAGKGGD